MGAIAHHRVKCFPNPLIFFKKKSQRIDSGVPSSCGQLERQLALAAFYSQFSATDCLPPTSCYKNISHLSNPPLPPNLSYKRQEAVPICQEIYTASKNCTLNMSSSIGRGLSSQGPNKLSFGSPHFQPHSKHVCFCCLELQKLPSPQR